MSEIYRNDSFDAASLGYVDYKIYDLSNKVNSELNEIKDMIKGNSNGTPVSSAVCLSATPEGTTGHVEKYSRIIDLTGLTWDQGSLNFGTDTEINSDTRIRTAEHIPLDGSSVTDITISATDTNGNDLMIDYTVYDENKKVIETIIWYDSGTQKSIPGDTKFLRVLLKRSNEGSITPNALNSCVMEEKFL